MSHEDGVVPSFQSVVALPSSFRRAASEALSWASADTSRMDLMRGYSICTSVDGTEEEEALSMEIGAELAADFNALHCRGAGGDAQPAAARGEAAPLSRGCSMRTASSSLSDGEETVPPPSLYEQLGGGVVVKSVVDDFYASVMASPAMARFFEGVDMAKHRRKFLLFVTYALGGPDEYLQLAPEPWPQLYTAHERLITQYGLNETHFDSIKELFGKTLVAKGAPPHLVRQALGVVESTRRVLFPLDPAAQRAKEALQPKVPCPHAAERRRASSEGPAAPAAAPAGKCPYSGGARGSPPAGARCPVAHAAGGAAAPAAAPGGSGSQR